MARNWTRRERDALRDELAGTLRGEVRFRDSDRALYSTDASIYQVMPIGVVQPADQEDAARAVRICLEAGAPVLPRGGGTSLAGQTVGRAVVVDLSRHLDRIVSVDAAKKIAVVEPGVVQSRLNAHLAPMGLMLGPDTASGSRATLGGMLGNNSSGSHSILYGKTVDAVRRVKAALSDGLVHELGPMKATDLVLPAATEERPDGLMERLFRYLADLRRDHQRAILENFPTVMRRVSGYNLDAALGEKTINLASLLVGSEGSLGTALEMEIDLVDAPATKGVALVHFPALDPAIEATCTFLDTGPSAVELMDDMLLDLAAANPTFAKKMWFMEDGTRAVQLVEYFADSPEELAEKFGRLEAAAAKLPGSPRVVRADEAWQVHDAWAIRKAGLPLLSSIPSERKPLPFVEDTAVDPEKLPEFVRRFKQVVDEHETQAAYYAHASAGCLHIRPLLDLSRQDDRVRLESISEAIFELVVEFGGSMSGEHGDGRARSHYNARLFGDRVYQQMRRLKGTLDRENLFNPGQVVDAPAMGDDLRWDFDRTPASERPQGFAWSNVGGFHGAVKSCNGTAACRQVGEGSMCPTYMALREEEHSTRGRANLLRSAITGALEPEELYGDGQVAEALELCLSCKACKSECPVRVDMAKIQAEWRHGRNQARGARPRKWLELARPFAGLANGMASSVLGKAVTKAVLGMTGERPLPPISSSDGRALARDAAAARATPDAPRGPVVLFADTFSCHMDSRALEDAAAVLAAAGHEVVVPALGCCGRPAVGQGDLEHARALASANLAALTPHVEAGTPVVGVEPGCLSMFWDELVDLVPGPEAEALAAHVQLFDEYVLELMDDGFEPELHGLGADLGVHLHCHQDALGKGDSTALLLAKLPDQDVTKLGGGCCGMAGDFGYKHPEVADAVFARTDVAATDGPVCAPGWSCRGHMRHHGKQAYAGATLLRMAMDGDALEV
jgi:FAD/FMN-containing dehydrogenase/Fe-S oxidoreductase